MPSCTATVNGSNKDFTLPTTPSAKNAAWITLNGRTIERGSGAGKHTISSLTVKYGTAPVPGQVPYDIVFIG